MKYHFLLFIFLITVVVGCKSDPLPKGALKKDRFIQVLVDVHIAEGMYDDKYRLKMDTLMSAKLYNSVLEKHHVTNDQMLKTTLYYTRHQKEYDKIFSEVLSKINAMSEEGNMGNDSTSVLAK